MDNKTELYFSELESWLTERKKDLHYSHEQFDKLIIMLSSGGLVLTIGFVRDIVTITNETNTSFLKDSWYLFASALIINLLAQVSSFTANNIELKKTKLELAAHRDNIEFDENSFSLKLNNFIFKIINSIIKIFNILSFISIIIGIILFVIFVNQNI